MELLFLGTSCMVPTKERNHSAILLSYKSEGILFDCGEGTQRQLRIAGVKPTKITKIIISHWHGDHVLGIPGLIQTLGASEYSGVLEIYGPKGTKDHFEAMFRAFVFDKKIDIKINEIGAGTFIRNKNFSIHAEKLSHGIDTLGYLFIEHDRRRINTSATKKLGLPEGPVLGKLQDGEEVTFRGKKISTDEVTRIVKGKKIAFVSDTTPCTGAYNLAEGADIVICESSYTSKLEEKAEHYKHMTAREAGLLASRSSAKELILTHFSARYKDSGELMDDAKEVFENVRCAEDFMSIKL